MARALAGLPVSGHRFSPNVAWCEWALANGSLPTEEQEEEEGKKENCGDGVDNKDNPNDLVGGGETDDSTDSAASEEEVCWSLDYANSY